MPGDQDDAPLEPEAAGAEPAAGGGGSADASVAAPPAAVVGSAVTGRLFKIRGATASWERVLYGVLFVLLVLAAWWLLTLGAPEERPRWRQWTSQVPTPAQTFASFPSLWFDRALTRNTVASLRRVALGFGLAALVGVPLGILCGCFPRLNAFFAPFNIFGRNIPVAALIPLTFAVWGIEEQQKVMFIFIATVAFIVSDAAQAVADVEGRFMDTAYTLGASRWQVIAKVFVPLAAPAIFNSLRLLFGLAFGYIMLAEVVKLGGESGGLGDIIITSQRRGQREHILLVLMIIPVVALGIDRALWWVQKELFPHRYGGTGLLNRAVVAALGAWDDLKLAVKGFFFTSERRRP